VTEFESIADATDAAIKAATHLTAMDSGAVAMLRELARVADVVIATGGINEAGKFDNVTVPTYLKACDALGLTPAGRVRLDEKKESVGGKLAQLRAVNGGKR
jgi:hypothetical protein